jgi:carboxypeptidase C (cathepsin A)
MRTLFLTTILSLSLWGQAAAPAPAPPAREEPPVVKQQELTVGGRTLRYTSTTGMLPIRNAAGETEANIFFIAYTLDGVADRSKRRLMFSFNGGPGSASVWLHLGALGPKRVKMNDDGSMPAAPYQLVPNDSTWLDETDLVFIDPVGTGYSRATKPDLARKFFGVQGDIESVGEFIRLYLTRYERWTSPLFLVGESYGTTRAAGLAGYLVEQGIALNGVCLVSTVLQFQTVRFGRANDTPYVLILPTFTATAWYHKRLSADLQKDLRKTLAEAEKFAITEYAEALNKGDKMTAAERKAVVDKIARYTGLDPKYVDQADLRITTQAYMRELQRDKNILVGRLDSRLTGPGLRAVTPTAEFDPSNTAIRPPYTALFAQYVRTELGYKTDAKYYVLGGGIGQWNWGVDNGYAETADSLRQAFAKNPHMKLYVGSGYYDMATPYFAADYTLNHMGLPPQLRQNIRTHEYEAGHMYYIHVPSLQKMKTDVASFLQWATP